MCVHVVHRFKNNCGHIYLFSKDSFTFMLVPSVEASLSKDVYQFRCVLVCEIVLEDCSDGDNGICVKA